MDQACTSISDVSEVESEGCLPEELHIAQLHFTHHTCMESKESSSVEDRDGVQDYVRQQIRQDKTEVTEDKETCTTSKCLEDI